MKVSSVHNFCLIPTSGPNKGGGGDVFLLSHPFVEERRKAVKWTKRTIRYACAVGAKVVVLHCGRVEMNDERQRLYAFFNNGQIPSPPALNFICTKLEELEKVKPIHQSGVLRSLEDLIPTAEKNDIILGLENRYHYHELPGADDFDLIFETFCRSSHRVLA